MLALSVQILTYPQLTAILFYSVLANISTAVQAQLVINTPKKWSYKCWHVHFAFIHQDVCSRYEYAVSAGRVENLVKNSCCKEIFWTPHITSNAQSLSSRHQRNKTLLLRVCCVTLCISWLFQVCCHCMNAVAANRRPSVLYGAWTPASYLRGLDWEVTKRGEVYWLKTVTMLSHCTRIHR